MVPDIRHYQQIPLGGATGPYDCTFWSGAILVEAHSQGATTTTGRALRLASDEPRPDPNSPGGNLPQVDAAVLRVTHDKINLDTRVQTRSLTREEIRYRIVDGRWATLQVNRDILVDRGYGGGNHFRGLHALTVHHRPQDQIPIIGDPLVPYYIASSWDAVFDAAQAMPLGGRIYSQFARDLTPDYVVKIIPTPPATRKSFFRYKINASGHISSRELYSTPGIGKTHWLRSTAPVYASAAPGKPRGWSRYLVRILEGERSGWLVDAVYSREVEP